MIDAIVRVSFQTEGRANQAVSLALTGFRQVKTAQDRAAQAPFKKLLNTAAYHCPSGADSDVVAALSRLVMALDDHSSKLDYVSVTLVRVDPDTTAERL